MSRSAGDVSWSKRTSARHGSSRGTKQRSMAMGSTRHGREGKENSKLARLCCCIAQEEETVGLGLCSRGPADLGRGPQQEEATAGLGLYCA